MTTSAASSARSRQLGGLVLLLVAIVALLDRYVTLHLGLTAPFLIGVGFLVWSLVVRQVRLLIPAGILLGLGAGLLVERAISASGAVERALFFFCFAGGWGSITLLSQTVFRQRVLWPLIPAAVMAGLAVMHLMGTQLWSVWRSAYHAWPFVALGLALWLLFGGRGRK